MKNKLLIATLILIVFIGGFYFIRGNTTGYNIFTGSVVLDTSTLTNNQVEVIDISKSSNTVLEINVKTTKSSTVFVETDDCDYWKQGNDRDNSALLAFPVNLETTYNIGNPNDKTQQQIELYKANKLCLIIVNREDGNNEITVKATEKEKDRWDIIG